MKPEKPITRKEMYLDVATGGSTELPSPVTREEKYLAKIAGESVDIPTPVTRYEMLLAAVAGESYTPTPVTRLEIYLAKAAGQDVEIPQPVTREEMYWFDYCGGTPTPPEREYTGAVPVTFVADGTPLIDYLISGNTVQNGTPTPDSPIMPQGTGERTANLYFKKLAGANISDSGVIATITGFDLYIAEVEQGVQYSGNGYIYAFFEDVPAIGSISFNNSRVVESFKNIVSPINGFVAVRNPNTIQNAMCNTGNTILPYEPYGYKILISSANTTTPVYLGEVQTTRNIKKLVFDGTENFTLASTDTNRTVCQLPLRNCKGNYGFCTHILWKSPYESSEYNRLVWTTTSGGTLFISLSNEYLESQTVADFKTYLQQQYANGTPVTVWYILVTPETAVVNEPLMRIGDYADTLSMEQAGVQIPTANGSTTLDVETTVPPSEVYIKYRGEAVTTLSSLPAEVSSTEATTEEENPEETEETENGSEDVSL